MTLIIFETTQPTSIRHPQGGEVFDGSSFKPINCSLPINPLRESIPTSEYLNQCMPPLDYWKVRQHEDNIFKLNQPSATIGHLSSICHWYWMRTTVFSAIKLVLMQPQFGRWKHMCLHLGHKNHLRFSFHPDRHTTWRDVHRKISTSYSAAQYMQNRLFSRKSGFHILLLKAITRRTTHELTQL